MKGSLFVEMSSSFAERDAEEANGEADNDRRGDARREAAKPSEERDAHRPKKTKASTRELAEH